MYFAYVDESGDPGVGGSKAYVVGCVLVPAAVWPSALDDLIQLRRTLRSWVRLPVRSEVKAHYLVHNGGPFRGLGLSEQTRRRIYREHMRLHAGAGFKTFAILVKKSTSARDHRALAWEYTLQRLERFSSKGGGPIVLVHDEGEGALIRKMHRKARRAGTAGQHYGAGSIMVPAKFFVEDPVSRSSADTYFIQLADLAAYAAFRKVYPPQPGPRPAVVPETMWDELGPARLLPVNAVRGGIEGLVVVA